MSYNLDYLYNNWWSRVTHQGRQSKSALLHLTVMHVRVFTSSLCCPHSEVHLLRRGFHLHRLSISSELLLRHQAHGWNIYMQYEILQITVLSIHHRCLRTTKRYHSWENWTSHPTEWLTCVFHYFFGIWVSNRVPFHFLHYLDVRASQVEN